LGDRHGTITTWIKGINLTASCGLRDRAGPGFARGGTATRICIVPNAGHPCSGGVCLGDRDCSKHEDRDWHNHHRETTLTHLQPPLLEGLGGADSRTRLVVPFTVAPIFPAV